MADELYQHERGSIRVNSDDCMSTSYLAGCLRCREPWPCAFVRMVEQRDAEKARAEAAERNVRRLLDKLAACDKRGMESRDNWAKVSAELLKAEGQVAALRTKLQYEHDANRPCREVGCEPPDCCHVGKAIADTEAVARQHDAAIECEVVERCAKVADGFNAAGVPIAAAIRALKNKE